MTTDPWRVQVGDVLTPADTEALREALDAFNVAVTGLDDGADLACVVRDDEGRLVAGLDGFSWGGYARLEHVWVGVPASAPPWWRAAIEESG